MAKHSKTGISMIEIQAMSRSLGLSIRREQPLNSGTRVWILTDGTQAGTAELPTKAEVYAHLRQELKNRG